jgi:hypothetical protein
MQREDGVVRDDMRVTFEQGCANFRVRLVFINLDAGAEQVLTLACVT